MSVRERREVSFGNYWKRILGIAHGEGRCRMGVCGQKKRRKE